MKRTLLSRHEGCDNLLALITFCIISQRAPFEVAIEGWARKSRLQLDYDLVTSVGEWSGTPPKMKVYLRAIDKSARQMGA